MKTSARRTLEKSDAVYLSTIDDGDGAMARERFDEWRAGLTIELDFDSRPVFTQQDIPELVTQIRALQAGSLRTAARMPALQS